jgi:hypothetical protein
MDSNDVVRALEQVPAFRLRLIDLVGQVIREDGSLDQDKVAFHRLEIEAAIAEAQAYSHSTKELVQWLLMSLARS